MSRKSAKGCGARSGKTVAVSIALAINTCGVLVPPPAAAEDAIAGNQPSVARTIPADGPVVRLGLDNVIDRVIAANAAVLSRRTGQEVADQEIVKAGSIFQPLLNLSVSDSRLREKNTPEERLLRSGLGVYDRRSQDVSVGVSNLLPTGAKVEVKGTVSRLESNVSDQRRGFNSHDYKSFYGLSLTQPLLRDAGVDVTRNKIEVARLDADVARDVTEETSLSVLSEAISVYYDLALSQERLRMWEDGIGTMRLLHDEAKTLHQAGRLPVSDIWDVEVSLTRYHAGAAAAQQERLEQMNRLRTLLNVSAQEEERPLLAADPLPKVTLPEVSFDKSLQVALENRPDYKMHKKIITRENLKIDYADNQTLPRVDLVANYGVNDLTRTVGDSLGGLDPNYPSWTVGIQVTIPFGPDERANAELRSAQLTKRKAQFDLQAVETALANDVDTSLKVLKSSHDRWEMLRRTLEMEMRQVKVERDLLAAGRSDMREVLTREERVIQARNAMLEQAVTFAKARMALEVAQGTLVERRGSGAGR